MSIYTVSQISNILSAKLRTEPKFRGIAVKGEITDLGRDRAGHMYFRLTDGDCSIKAVMFAQYAAKLRFAPFDGISAIAYGALDYYQRDGSCEIKVAQLLPDGAGAEYLSLIKLKEKLEALGIFSAPKKPVPKYPKSIAVVTSPDGAALQDIKNITSRRYPIAKLTVFPTLVQGDFAPQGIVSALSMADSSGADVIILTRGGGSSDDLSAFNAETVVMAVASCSTPVISAVGHETDWTLSDLAADLRAPTPSGAAELATPDIAEMRRELDTLSALLKHSALSRIGALRENLRGIDYMLIGYSLSSRIKARRKELEALSERLENGAQQKIRLGRLRLESIGGLLESLDPQRVVSRGYAIVYKNGELIPQADMLSAKDEIRIIMRGGSVGAEVTGELDEL